MTFRVGEAALSDWMARNALVAWVPHPAPWEAESALITSTSLPLNLDQNRGHAHHARLSELRRSAKARAQQLTPHDEDDAKIRHQVATLASRRDAAG